MFKKVAFTMYPITDVTRARRFYEHTLGLERGTIAFEVEDLDALIAHLRSNSVTLKGDLIDSPVCRMAVCLDSEGNSILLHQLKPRAS